MKRIAFRLPADGVWTGGVNYLETVCRALLSHSDLGYEPVAFCNSDGDPALLTRFESLIGARLVCDPAVARGRRAGLAGALAFGRNNRTLALCRRHRCEVFMEAAEYQGWRFPVACLVWVPDFQDRHLPHLFSARSLYGKYLGLAHAIGHQAHRPAQQRRRPRRLRTVLPTVAGEDRRGALCRSTGAAARRK